MTQPELTPRELQIVSKVVEGYANREIAHYLKIGEDNVKYHLSTIFDKLDVSDREELVRFVAKHRLLERVNKPPAGGQA